MKSLLTFLAVCFIATAAWAVEPREMLKDPVLEARAREVSKSLRCVQCQNETIDESSAEIAHAMRLLVRERIVAGDTNEQILAYMVSRYGDYVLLRPRFMPSTLLLWLGPAVVLILGGLVAVGRLRRVSPGAAPLTADEQAEIAVMTAEERRTE